MKANNDNNLVIWKFWTKLLGAILFLVLLAGVFFLVSFFIIRKSDSEQDIFSANKRRFNTVLNTEYGFTDRGFSQQAVEGVCKAFNIPSDECNGANKYFLNSIIGYGYPKTMSDSLLLGRYIDNFIQTEKVNNFVLPGYTFTQFLCDLNHKYERQKVTFIAVGTYFAPNNPSCKYNDQARSWPKNLWQIGFKQHVAGFHAGLYAGLYALKNPHQFKDYDAAKPGKQIAFAALGGMWIPAIMKYALGFKYGLELVNKNKMKFADVDQQNTVIFTDYKDIQGFDAIKYSSPAKKLASQLYKKKVSVIFSIAVSLTAAISLAASEDIVQNNGKKQSWVIGVDVDQGVLIFNEYAKSDQPLETKGNILTSSILKIDDAVAKVINDPQYKNKPARPIAPFGDGGFATIPDRFQETAVWKSLKANGLLDENVSFFKNFLAKTDCLLKLIIGIQSASPQERQRASNYFKNNILNDPNSSFDDLETKLKLKCT